METINEIIKTSGIDPKYFDVLFEWACKNGQLEIAKWLVAEHNIDVHVDNDNLFKLSCTAGQLQIAKWLATEHNADIHTGNEEVFKYSCKNGYTEIVKWLISEYDVDIHAENEASLAMACQSGRIGIIKLFTEEYNFNSFKYGYYNKTAYIVNHPELKGWKSCTILNCPIIYRGDLNEQAVIRIMSDYTMRKSARS
jgi:hypothetical protein